MCLRDVNGKFIVAKTAWFYGIPQPQEAEARGLKEVIIWLGTQSLEAVCVELDCKLVVDVISNNFRTSSKLGAILKSCKASLSLYPNLKR
jgi:hypothetical protein